MKTNICLAVVVIANSLGNVLLTRGMRDVGDIASYSPVDLVLSGTIAMFNPWVMSGIGLLLIFFIAHALVLSWADLSYVMLTTSIGYVVVTFFGWWLLGEHVSVVRWTGVGVITAGVMLVGSTPTATVPKESK